MKTFPPGTDDAPLPSPPAVGRLQLGMDLPFERRWWRFERRAWYALWAFLALGFAGVFGRGPLSQHAVHGAHGALTVTYERFARFGTPVSLRVEISSRAAAPNGTVTIHVSAAQMQKFPPQSIAPKPALERADGAGGVFYSWYVPRSAPSSTIYIGQMPVAPGIFTSRVALAGSPGVRFRQVVYP